MGLFFGHVGLPMLQRPDLQMILHADENDFILQLCQRRQLRRNADPSLAVDFDVLGLAVEQPAERPHILPRWRALRKALT